MLFLSCSRGYNPALIVLQRFPAVVFRQWLGGILRLLRCLHDFDGNIVCYQIDPCAIVIGVLLVMIVANCIDVFNTYPLILLGGVVEQNEMFVHV